MRCVLAVRKPGVRAFILGLQCFSVCEVRRWADLIKKYCPNRLEDHMTQGLMSW